ncbi:SET domain-containing protein [Desulfosarcina sp.]|nr:SET domain-containing protein [Desulfosarcina sp.]
MSAYKLTYVTDSGIHGKGLFARMDIEEGTYLGEYEGPVAQRNGTHVLWVYEDDGVIGRSGRNKLRYLNHSVSACAEFELFASRKIKSGEEITINYGEDWEGVD